MSSALFGGSSAQSRSRTLVEFKAGKMTLKGKMVHPDKRKGLVYAYQSDDSLMHFCWKDRSTGIVEDDLILFPDDIEVRKLAQCTTGRVFLMKFKSSNKKFFFWMQETDAEKDEKLWKKVNDLFNNPPGPGSGSSAAGSAGGSLANALGGDIGGQDLHNILTSMNEQQLQMFLGNLMPANSPSSNRSGSSTSMSSNQTSRVQSTVGGSRADATAESTATTTTTTAAAAGATTTTSTAATEQKPAVAQTNVQPMTPAASAAKTQADSDASGANKKIQLSDLQKILGNLTPDERHDLDLSEVINLDVMAPILANKEVQERLIQYLPDSEYLPKTEQEIRTTLTTFQFKKAMHSFSSALQRGQLGPILKQFNLPEKVTLAAAQGNVLEFAKAMEEYSKTLKKDDDQMDTK